MVREQGPVSGRGAFELGRREELSKVTRTSKVTLDRRAWRKLAYDVLYTEGVKRMTAVRDACRDQSGIEGYMLSIEGPKRLPPVAPIVTVITATGEAIKDNAANQRLVKNFSLASGE